MSFLSGLGKVLGIAGGVAGAPFTGGASLIPTLLGAGGAALSGAAKGSASDRASAADYALLRDKNALDAAGRQEAAILDRAALDLERRKFQEATAATDFQNAMRSALALNRQPMARPAGVPTIDFVGAGIGPQGRAAAEAVNAQALGRLQGGGATFDPIAAAPSFALTSSASLPKASTFEKLAGLLGLGLTAAGAVGKEYNKTRGGTT